ncbi:MAG: GntR family transcriptional regulator, partial [Synergistaceae bacterium]|nr:GntR family transcriptional regulator [Synergistaceae bacterium]
MITTVLDPAGSQPMYLQLYRFIRREIETGRLAVEARLPSRPKLAAHLNVSLVTVGTAYAQLTAEGYIRSVPRSGFYVQPLVAHSFPDGPTAVLPAERRGEESPDRCKYDFQTNLVDTDLFPYSIWARLARKV